MYGRNKAHYSSYHVRNSSSEIQNKIVLLQPRWSSLVTPGTSSRAFPNSLNFVTSINKNHTKNSFVKRTCRKYAGTRWLLCFNSSGSRLTLIGCWCRPWSNAFIVFNSITQVPASCYPRDRDQTRIGRRSIREDLPFRLTFQAECPVQLTWTVWCVVIDWRKEAENKLKHAAQDVIDQCVPTCTLVLNCITLVWITGHRL